MARICGAAGVLMAEGTVCSSSQTVPILAAEDQGQLAIEQAVPFATGFHVTPGPVISRTSFRSMVAPKSS